MWCLLINPLEAFFFFFLNSRLILYLVASFLFVCLFDSPLVVNGDSNTQLTEWKKGQRYPKSCKYFAAFLPEPK